MAVWNPAIEVTQPTIESRSLLWIPSIFILAALGPYVGDYGLKAEHIVVYGVAGTYLVLNVSRFLYRPWGDFFTIMFLWLAVGISQGVGFCLSSTASVPPPTPRLLAAIEHLIQPLVIVAIVCAWAKTLPQDRLARALRIALNILISGVCINSILILWIMRTGNTDLFLPWLPPSGAEPKAVWNLSMETGRFTGIFNQPFESGLSYSLGLLGWSRLQSERKQPASWEYGRLILLLFGGIVSVSKVFIFGGIPLLIVLSSLGKSYRKSIFNWKYILLSVAVVFAVSGLQEYWTGFSFFSRLFSPEKGTDLVNLYTANRFGGGGTQVKNYLHEVWNVSPLFGFGFAPYEVLDNGFLWAFASGGAICLSIFILLIAQALFWTGTLARHNREQIFPFLMVVLMVSAAAGAPSFTINRASVVFWTLFPLATLAGLAQSPHGASLPKSAWMHINARRPFRETY